MMGIGLGIDKGQKERYHDIQAISRQMLFFLSFFLSLNRYLNKQLAFKHIRTNSLCVCVCVSVCV